MISENMVTNQKRGIFKGHVYLVNPKHDEIISEKCYRFLSDIPEHVETVLVGKIAKTVGKYGKPVTVCDMGAAEMAQTMLREYEKRGLPSFDVPDRAARALWALSYYGTYLLEEGIVRESNKAS